ncbi:metalloreductase Fre8 [Durotheca rogersii]|uniref:metalloreductase Fre8 n=1 Tax=Durotheca rogersii TaxID=419775 RepID=UPI00221F8193|nr:metalloreductase Fre8 [Durotheca rogersii]KAI5863704.1 metalloreductase Fre8 [Durotheca rogersii]
MGWPYHFLDLDAEQKHARRQALDRYAACAQLSALVPIAVFLLYRFGSWLVGLALTEGGGDYAVVPHSPALKRRRQSCLGSLAGASRRVAWWLGDDVVFLGTRWGQRDQIIVGICWAAWLLFLCVIGTGDDYMHLTKRFGIVALSQFPLQYLLALKSINPIALAFRSSHEQVNRWHRVLGWVIYFLLLLHASFYLNFYVQYGVVIERLTRLIPALGLTSIIGMTLMNTTALRALRQYSYRIFFITHILVAFMLPPMIFFHSHHGGRQYVVEALLVLTADLVKRKIDTVTVPATLEFIPGTSLMKIVVNIPSPKLSRFRKYPGMHVYLSIPYASRRSSGVSVANFALLEFSFNPFTIASLDEESGDLTLVARRQKGLMTKTLARLVGNDAGGAKIPLSIEGPYGCATQFPNLTGAEFQRILLVAGGVGATFILPLYRYVSRLISNENPAARVQMVWAVRKAGDATWPVSGTAGSILDDENLNIFLTGDVFATADETTVPDDEDDEGIELTRSVHDNLDQDTFNRKRPDLEKVVDDFFRQGLEDRVAVLVCGPEAMARELRGFVGAWVEKGRDVWWHNESFAW